MIVCKKNVHVSCRPSKSQQHLQSSRLFPIPSFPLATMRATTRSKPRRTLSQVLIYFLIFSTPYALWHCLCAISHTSSPIVVVTSESMEPIFQRGDVLFVSNRTPSIELGDIVVCWFEGRRLPFVHRVIEKHALPAGTRGNERYGRGNSYCSFFFATTRVIG